ncbi:hypothetical protein NIES4071_56200 [Calothrix sp. NIES-4071]|nr:hypothetical protein NIES4071_56200 [Calothrix sp. NIES-4071]BAZ59927.1 hypothetical protein NIES4105_56150 [Calothrix sp. NIES-4105]
MSQNTVTHLGSQLSKTPSLKPPLAAALAGMEVQLDRELARYRRTRTGGYRASNQSSSYTPNSSSVGLQYLTPVTATPPENVADSINLDENTTEIPIPENVTPSTSTNEIPLPPPPPPPPPPPLFPDVTITPPVKETAISPQNSGSIVPVTTIKASKDENIEPRITDSTSQNQPEDYLESSEALLRSLTEEAPKAEKRPKSNSDTLLSPLGIGSILLLLMASVILGYVVINPKSLPQFSLNGLFKRNNSTATNTDIDSQSSNGNTQTVAQPQLTPIPRYPNLAKDEFPEVKTPNDVVGLTPKPKPTLAPTPTVPLENSSPSPSSVIAPPSPIEATQTPVAITPSPTPTQDIPLNDLKPSSDGFYHVVIDNNGGNAFDNARKVVPDAYLSPDGKLIYLGAIKNKQKVQELLTEIRGKGLDARVK